MNDTAARSLPLGPEQRLVALERGLEELRTAVATRNDQALDGRVDRLSMIVFDGSLDRLIAAFVLATGAAAMGMSVDMFFTFWATAALRKERVSVSKSFMARVFGWMLPKGSRKLPLSQMQLGGAGPLVIRGLMKKQGVASLEEMIALAANLGVNVNVCTMSMDLLGMQQDEMIDYPNLSYCGVATFLGTAAPGKITLFL